MLRKSRMIFVKMLTFTLAVSWLRTSECSFVVHAYQGLDTQARRFEIGLRCVEFCKIC